MFYGGVDALSGESYLCTVNYQSALTACFADDVGTLKLHYNPTKRKIWRCLSACVDD
jgi:hypothetical protein